MYPERRERFERYRQDCHLPLFARFESVSRLSSEEQSRIQKEREERGERAHSSLPSPHTHDRQLVYFTPALPPPPPPPSPSATTLALVSTARSRLLCHPYYTATTVTPFLPHPLLHRYHRYTVSPTFCSFLSTLVQGEFALYCGFYSATRCFLTACAIAKPARHF